jgi:hypothetical protein
VTVALDVNTTQGRARYRADLQPGLNVLNADNSWGKSTLLQSVVFALGLEGSLSASRRTPLGPAMTQAIDTDTGRVGVVESSASVTLRNSSGQYLRVQRWAISPDVEKTLVHVWLSDTQEGLVSAPRLDMFVRERRATTSALGFHRILENFLGWALPRVPDHSGGETPLYLEVLFPLSMSNRNSAGPA